MSQPSNITGVRFGRLVALKRAESKRYPCGAKLSAWVCMCDCGNETVVTLSALTSGNTKSCGCLHREAVKAINYRHGESHTRLNEVWKQMKKRCQNPNSKEYQWYGAKGVKVCKEWNESFEAFRDWMLNNGYDPTAPRGECTIDRINPFGNYEPSNCRVVAMDVQRENVRRKYEHSNRLKRTQKRIRAN